MDHDKKTPFFKTSEVTIATAGLLFLVNVPVIWLTGNFTFWFATAFLYAVGVVLFVMNK